MTEENMMEIGLGVRRTEMGCTLIQMERNILGNMLMV